MVEGSIRPQPHIPRVLLQSKFEPELWLNSSSTQRESLIQQYGNSILAVSGYGLILAAAALIFAVLFLIVCCFRFCVQCFSLQKQHQLTKAMVKNSTRKVLLAILGSGVLILITFCSISGFVSNRTVSFGIVGQQGAVDIAVDFGIQAFIKIDELILKVTNVTGNVERTSVEIESLVRSVPPTIRKTPLSLADELFDLADKLEEASITCEIRGMNVTLKCQACDDAAGSIEEVAEAFAATTNGALGPIESYLNDTIKSIMEPKNRIISGVEHTIRDVKRINQDIKSRIDLRDIQSIAQKADRFRYSSTVFLLLIPLTAWIPFIWL